MGCLTRIVLRLLIWPLILSVPFTGMWFASSWAAYANGPRWLVLLAGALLFPIGPVVWEIWAERRRRARIERNRNKTGFFARMRSKTNERWTSFGDRMLLRTLFVNLLFIGTLLYSWPGPTLTAVAARGDWVLDGMQGPRADSARGAFRMLADELQAFNGDFGNNPFSDQADTLDDRLPTLDELGTAVGEGLVSAVRRELTEVPVTITLPPGASGQLDTHILEGTSTLDVPPAPTTLSVRLADGTVLRCPLDPTVKTAVFLAGALAGVDCEALKEADPSWRPEVRMESRRFSRLSRYEGLSSSELARAQKSARTDFLEAGESLFFDAERKPFVLGPVVVKPSQVVQVRNNAPYLRIEVAPEARDTLCASTQDKNGARIVVVVNGRVRYARLVHEAYCDGFLPIDSSVPIQTQWGKVDGPDAASGTSTWPYEPTPDPRVANLPPERLVSLQALGSYLASVATSEEDKARLVHDWVAVNVRYDVDSLKPGKRAPQDADTVFRRKTGVCAGYANLVRALGRAAGLEVVYLTGNVRDSDGSLAGSGHAWNAIKVDGHWLLVDATWNSGFNDEKGEFQFRYGTSWLFPPAAVFAKDHLPEKPAWQLTRKPMSRGEFLRQDLMGADAAAMGITLVDPAVPQVDARSSLTLTLDNTTGASITAKVADKRCTVRGTTRLTVTCGLPVGGTHDLQIFAKAKEDTGRMYRQVGRVVVNVR